MADETLCRTCSQPAEPGYAVPMCAACRDACVRRPFPVWTRIVAVMMLIIMIGAVVNFAATVRGAVAFERGKRAQAGGRFSDAAGYYRMTLARFPGTTVAMSSLAICTYRSGNIREALDTLKQLKGISVPRADRDEIAGIYRSIAAGDSLERASRLADSLTNAGAAHRP